MYNGKSEQECPGCGERGYSDPSQCPYCREAKEVHEARTAKAEAPTPEPAPKREVLSTKPAAPDPLPDPERRPMPAEGEDVSSKLIAQINLDNYNLHTAEGRMALDDTIRNLSCSVYPERLRPYVQDVMKTWRWAVLAPYREVLISKSQKPSKRVFGPGGAAVGQKLAEVMAGQDSSMLYAGRAEAAPTSSLGVLVAPAVRLGDALVLSLPAPAKWSAVLDHAQKLGVVLPETPCFGFMTSRGTFVAANRAREVAYAAGQVAHKEGDPLTPWVLW